jgi:hypothetical protein
MPGTFLSSKERERLACFPEDIPNWDLITYFILTEQDHTFIKPYRSDAHRLAVALQLCAVRYLGFCPTALHGTPIETISHLAGQLHVSPSVLQDYGTRRMTQSTHFQAVLDYLGFRRMQSDDQDRLLSWLTERALEDGMVAVPVPPHDIPFPAQQRAAQRQAHRQALHTQVWTLHRQGWTAPAIAQQVGLSLRTVQRDLRTTTFAGRKRRSDLGDSLLNPYKSYLLERWNAGCYTAMRLFRDLQQRGYRGSYGPVAAYARRLRQA